ncbi:hypothetical protein M2337_003200 [Sphingobium sp. B2D3A]|uniref:phage tail protein n=1 Tax=unclassified Sphingobium TaxID=2611147 RepID=UPI002223F8FC|nr:MULTISPECIES: phage tail protein [unclassified Sphingobium]MCW2338967.1 hypothetical protein [Sphingobium sp. B2D3A]MCW2385392.1 hypothetical protein [Sphingobium sp. B2D3D]
MATLVLTAVGSALGGTFGAVGAAIGGAVGALAGRSVDALIFRPGGRTGPRLSDLQVQTSRYGAAIPRIHGTIRVAGTVIWATDLQESTSTSGGGKGSPSVTTYSYSASLAVALSSRPILGIGRIWADGNLLRGAVGDFKSPLTAFRLYLGGPDQMVDPLVASAVGVAQCPAYRGCAYVVFEGLQLADFGNRIPSLTFEVIADAEPAALPAIASDLAGRTVSHAGDGDPARLLGFAAEGTVEEAMRDIVSLHDVRWTEREGALALNSGRPTDDVIDPAAAVRSIDGEKQAEPQHVRTPIETVAARLAIRHHDPARDYQLGLQTALRAGPGMRSEEIDLPAAMGADDARRLADRKLRNALRRRRSVNIGAGWSALDLGPGDLVTVAGEPGQWLVETTEWDDMAVRLSLQAFESGTRAIAGAGASGEPVRQPDLVQGPTSLAIVELPGDGTTISTSPVIAAAASGSNAGWRRAALFRYDPVLEIAEPIGSTAPRAVMGRTGGALPPGAPWRIDLSSSIEIILDDPGDVLTGVGDDLLLGGANICQIGKEPLQFGQADVIAPGHYRLSRLVRGRMGTEWAMAGHDAGERFVLLDRERLAPISVEQSAVGTTLTLRAIGSGDSTPAQDSLLIDGRALMPLSPVHGRRTTLAGGDVEISWVRRSRLGSAWIDGVDAPLGEEREAYAVSVVADGVTLRRWETTLPSCVYAASDVAADLAAAALAGMQIEVRQLGSWGAGRALVIPWP